MINADLVAEDTRVAVRRVPRPGAAHVRAGRVGGALPLHAGGLERAPNPQLVTEASDLAPGRALDVGCGEGADAIWLAERGWQVTAVDVSHGGAGARPPPGPRRPGSGSTGRTPTCATEPPAEAAYDLVSAQFMHLPPVQWRDLFARLAAAVAPGGTLLVVGHHPSDLRTTAHRMHFPDMMFTAEQLAAALDPDGWRIVAAETRPARRRRRRGPRHHHPRRRPGRPRHRVADTVVVASRAPWSDRPRPASTTAARADQCPSARLPADRVRHAVANTLRLLGVRGCAAQVAGEYGERPETAAARMTWAIATVRVAYPA